MNNTMARLFATLGDYFLLILKVIGVTLKRPPAFNLIRDQMFEIGVMSLPVVAITGFSTGLVLAAQSFFQLADKGLASATGLMVTKAMLVELGPILTAFMITGRVGAAMCAELGTMRVTEQIDALCSMSVNPLRYLIAPRFIAGITMLPLLTIFSCLMGILGGYLLSVYYFNMPPSTFLDPLPLHIKTFDMVSGLIKAFVFGIIIITISCYRGLSTRGGAAGVGRATTNSVVICYSVILIGNFVITIGLNGSYPYIADLISKWF
ncbi:ABC transporter permease [Parachlamydia sp. AcF125]|uniref:MlaE family ABC transporter permease n=1 Tax=Parachlamydia sp. AcF125 TaxID=2795736 RepID=UPI001BD816A2|nr:ABC transporter permease [Parachlamydia sp. AcF125]MBS4169050.1 putative phospholipid ABC transporter permease protein MlaE [Parachlamydia sp. AcF125]